MYKVEFIEGEKWCRINGELSTPKWWKEKTGIDGEFDLKTKSVISINGKLYLKEGVKLLTVLKQLGGTVYDKSESSQDLDHNFFREMTTGSDGAVVIKNLRFVDVKVFPYTRFTNDYPKYNEDEYNKIMKSLNNYYKKFTADTHKAVGLL